MEQSRVCYKSLGQNLAFLLVLLGSPSPIYAIVLYSQTFEGTTLATVGFGYATLNMGGSALVREVTATGGVGGSQGFSHTFDGTGRSLYSMSFSNILHPIAASDANPLTASHPSQIRFSMDVKTVGSLNSMSVRIGVSQTDENYEADRNIDLNGDGDKTDFAVVFGSSFSPTIIDGTDYIHASYTLDQGTLRAFQPNPPPIGNITLTPQFDPTVPLVWSVGFDNVGFGSDAGNIVSVDNVLVEIVPEPSTVCLLLAIPAVLVKTRRLR